MAMKKSPRPDPECPLVVAYGAGVNSTAMLVEFARRGIRPDLILFADTGGEKPETYAYLAAVRPFLRSAGFPELVVVRYRPVRAAYSTLEGQCLHTGTLPSLAYGGKSCSVKYKVEPQNRYVRRWPPALQCWRRGGRVVKAIGYDAGPSDSRRRHHEGDGRYLNWYPLAQWGMDRAACERSILGAGLPVPMKSACFFCPASKKQEVLWLREKHPGLLGRALAVERNAMPKLTSVKGLGRSFSWAAFLAGADDLPLFAPGCCSSPNEGAR
jgi:hypothetical protein